MDNQAGLILPESKSFVFSRFLPKTGQTVSYQTGDDGDYEKGWAIGQRFIPKTIGANDIVFDRATGLMWPESGISGGGNNGLWDSSLVFCGALTFAGFSDWRQPNMNELLSIMDQSVGTGTKVYSVFINIFAANYWTSTTDSKNAIFAMVLNFSSGAVLSILKAVPAYTLAVRGGK